MNEEKEGALVPEIMPAGAAIESMVRAEVDTQITTAKTYPREISTFQKRCLDMASLDRETSESCMYAIPRGGKVIEGPSVRFAEIVASTYGNIRVASQILAIEEKHVVCRATAIDLESNFAASVEVRRRITNKHGSRFNEDLIVVTANAGCAIAFRNAVFKVIPQALIKKVLDDIKKVAMGSERTLEEQRNAAFVYFDGQGIKKKRVLDVLGKKDIEDVTLENVGTLRGLITAISEGSTTLAESFPEEGGLTEGRHEKE